MTTQVVPTLADSVRLTENGLLISASVIVLVRVQRGPQGVKVVARAAAETPEGALVIAAGRVLYGLRADGAVRFRLKLPRKIYASPTVADDGTIEIGKPADLIVLDTDPLQDPAVFGDPKHVRLVMLGGDLV